VSYAACGRVPWLVADSPAVPGLLNVSNIVGSQLANVGSPDIVSRLKLEPTGHMLTTQTGALQLQMAKYANEILCSPDSVTDGVGRAALAVSGSD